MKSTENPQIGDRIIITAIQNVGGRRYYTSSMGKCPQDVILPYETTVTDSKHDTMFNGFSDGTYGFWTEKITWHLANPNYEIY